MQGTQTRPEALAGVNELWAEYKRTGDQRLRDRLVLSLSPIVKYIVFRKIREVPAHCEAEDFISCGLEALMRSIDRYDPARGAALESFVWTRVHGAVIDELRRSDWAPRSLRRWERDIERARRAFTAIHGRGPSREELADAMGVSSGELDRRQQDIARSELVSLNESVAVDDDTSIERIDELHSTDAESDPELAAVHENALANFREAFNELPARERLIISLLHVEGLTLREVGEVLGVSETRICQIRSQVRRKLRARLSDEHQLFSEFA